MIVKSRLPTLPNIKAIPISRNAEAKMLKRKYLIEASLDVSRCLKKPISTYEVIEIISIPIKSVRKFPDAVRQAIPKIENSIMP